MTRVGLYQYWLGPIILVILAVNGGSCVYFEKPAPDVNEQIVWARETPESLFARLKNDQCRISDWVSGYAIAIDPPPRGQPSNLRGIVSFIRKPQGPQARIKGLGPFGRLYFDMVQRAGRLEIYLPSQRTLYRGRTDRYRSSGGSWQEIFGSMMIDFAKLRLPSRADFTFEKAEVVLPLMDGELRFDRRNGWVNQWRQGNRVVRYGNYERREGLPPIPTRIVMETADGGVTVNCRLFQVHVNQGIDDDFDLSGYQPEKIRDLSELEISPSAGRSQ